MKGMFKVTYCDPVKQVSNMEAFTVIAVHAAHAIALTDRKKTAKKYRPESVELIGWADE